MNGILVHQPLLLQPDFDAAVKNSAFGVRVDFGERRVLKGRKNHLPETALARVGDIFGVDKQAEFAERFFAENAQNPVISLKGNITNDKLQGPLASKELSELVSLMSDGTVYVNVHSGEFQNGAVRGQIASGLPLSEVNVTSLEPNATLGVNVTSLEPNATLGQ